MIATLTAPAILVAVDPNERSLPHHAAGFSYCNQSLAQSVLGASVTIEVLRIPCLTP